MATAGPMKVTTLKKYMKDQTELRIDADAVDWLAGQVNDRVKRVVNWAGVLAEMEERTTLLLRDIEQAVEDVGSSSGDQGPAATPAQLFETIETYSIEQLVPAGCPCV
jgi:histone H3/H4